MKNVQLLARKCRSRRELPAVMVNKAARRAENMADAIKLQDACKPAGEWGSRQCQRKIVEKSGDSAFAFAGCQVLRALRGCSYSFPVAGKAVFASTPVCKVAFATYILTAKSKKSLARR